MKGHNWESQIRLLHTSFSLGCFFLILSVRVDFFFGRGVPDTKDAGECARALNIKAGSRAGMCLYWLPFRGFKSFETARPFFLDKVLPAKRFCRS